MSISLTFTLLLATTLASNQLVLEAPARVDNAVQGACNFKQYAALGDSYSVGLRSIAKLNLPVCNDTNNNGSAPYCTTEHCAKSYGAYAWLFHQSHPSAGFQFLACSGANSSNCTATQIPLLSNSTDLVTITIGGDNGNAFAQVVEDCVYVKIDSCMKAYANAEYALSYAKGNLTAVLAAIYKKAPYAKINVMSYVQFWSSTTNTQYCYGDFLKYVNAANKTLMNSLTLQFNGNNSQAVDVFNKVNSGNQNFVPVSFVNVDPFFAGNRLCDQVPYFQWEVANFTRMDHDDNGILKTRYGLWPVTGVFHPSELGQQAYLQALSTSLGC